MAEADCQISLDRGDGDDPSPRTSARAPRSFVHAVFGPGGLGCSGQAKLSPTAPPRQPARDCDAGVD
jgi:hypothetical protein